MQKLIYIMDPHCGWCFGNSANFSALYSRFQQQLDVEIIPGGMWLGSSAPVGGEGLAQFIQQHGPRMEATTNSQLGEAFHRLTADTSYTFSSLEPSAALVLAAQLAPSKAAEFCRLLLENIFVAGKRPDQFESYQDILQQLAIDEVAFSEQWLAADNLARTREQFAVAHRHVQGYPTLVLAQSGTPEVQYRVVASGYFNLQQVTDKLAQMIK